MKRILITFIVLSLLLGCDLLPTDPDNNDSNNSNSNVENNFILKEGTSLNYKGKELFLGDGETRAREILGEPTGETEYPYSQVTIFDYDNFSISLFFDYTWGLENIYATEGFQGITSKEAKIGMTKSQIREIYNMPDLTALNQDQYDKIGIVFFYNKENKVIEISIYSPK
jgi:hypothetical protein